VYVVKCYAAPVLYYLCSESCRHAESCIAMYCMLYCCTASKRLTLAVPDLSSIQPQLVDGEMSQSKIHIRVCNSFREQLIEYFRLLPPRDLDTDDVGECAVLVNCVCCLSSSTSI